MFYEKLLGDSEISTSQPALTDVTDLWDKLLKDYDEIVHIPMSSGLSAACESAMTLSRDYGGRVRVVDNQRISVTMRQSALDAVAMAEEGMDAAQIKEYLERVKFDSTIYIMLDTLKSLKKGGRITPAAAAFGTMLNIKPVLQVNGGKLDAYAKVRGVKNGRETIIEAVKKDLAGRFASFAAPEKCWIAAAYTFDKAAAAEFKNELEEAFPGYDIHMDPLSLSVACHIGPGALAATCTKKLDCI
jgi:DegV family protein with EDD domain